MKRLQGIFFLFVAVIAFSGCTGLGRSMKQSNYIVEFEKGDFEWSGQVTGEATQVKILMIDWARLFKKSSGVNESDGFTVGGGNPYAMIPVIGGYAGALDNLSMVKGYAMYELMNNNPGWDVVLYPTYEVNSFKIPVFFQRTTVKVTARMGKIK